LPVGKENALGPPEVRPDGRGEKLPKHPGGLL